MQENIKLPIMAEQLLITNVIINCSYKRRIQNEGCNFRRRKQRETFKRCLLSNLRKSGKVPAVLYGKDVEAESIFVDSKAFMSIIDANGANVIINLKFKDGKSGDSKNLQRDILTQSPCI